MPKKQADKKRPSALGLDHAEDSAAADANGLIKSIRPEQGKIRIAHDPIDKYGMPPICQNSRKYKETRACCKRFYASLNFDEQSHF